MLLARGFVAHDLRMADVSHLCNAVQMSKKSKLSEDQPFVFLGEGSGVDHMTGSSGSDDGGRERVYPYQGYAGSGPMKVDSQGSGSKLIMTTEYISEW